MSQAVFTLLYHPTYLPGALVLALGLRRLLGASPDSPTLGVLIDKTHFAPDQLNLLLQYYDELVEVDSLASPLAGKLADDLNRPELDKTFTKVLLWSLNFDKVLYLDADTVPVVDGSGSILDLLKVDFPSYKIVAAPDSGFPDIFNSGVFALKPNKETYFQLRKLVDETASNPNLSFDGADQGLLNQYFNENPDWVSALANKVENGPVNSNEQNTTPFGIESNWIKAPFLYNVTPSAQYEYLPAYKHFTEGTYKEGSKGGEPVVGGSNEDGSDSVLTSTVDTLDRYHTSALKFINQSSQIKLFHFIGPYKPWTLAEKHEIHKDWWKLWEDEFGTKSIKEVTEKKVDPVEIQDEIKEEPTFQEPEAPQVSGLDPKKLLDPANYQQFEDNIEHSADALWNPAHSAPPVSTGEVHEDSNKIVEGMKSFQNQWDVEEEKEEEEIQEQEQEQEPEVAEEKAPAPHFPVHDFVRPERVFDDVPDYFPQHKLQVTGEVRPQETSNEELDFLEDLTIGEQVNHLSKVELNREAEEVLEQEEENEPEIEYDDHVSKLFPWEYKSRAPVERVFE